jgi:hypothetical protein
MEILQSHIDVCSLGGPLSIRPRVAAAHSQGRYTSLVLSLLYPGRDWKDAAFHEDHIFPQSEFEAGALKKRGFDEAKLQYYVFKYNALPIFSCSPTRKTCGRTPRLLTDGFKQ